MQKSRGVDAPGGKVPKTLLVTGDLTSRGGDFILDFVGSLSDGSGQETAWGAEVSCFEPTYKGLKLAETTPAKTRWSRFEPTYKGLKQICDIR